jgi:transcriptional regulator with XRE-family HTH domain
MLKNLREKVGLSQAALAERAGLPLRSIQNWDQGHRTPRLQVLPLLARAMGVSVNTLVAGFIEDKLPGEDEPPPGAKGKRKPRRK